MIDDAQGLIDALDLEPLPHEGGFFKRTYLSPRRLGGAPALSCIYYLITAEAPSYLHRLQSDEIFHFYLGDPVLQLQLHPDGSDSLVVLGNDVLGGQSLQSLVPAGVWQGSMLVAGGRYALMGTSVSPAFTWEDFSLGRRDDLIARFPQRHDLIVELTRKPD